MQTLSSGETREQSKLHNRSPGRLEQVALDTPMFVSMPEYQFEVPPALAPANAKYWRSLSISTNAAWFVLTVRSRDPQAVPDTFLLAWDIDLVNVVKSRDVVIESLMFVAQHVRGPNRGWFSQQIREIWEATDTAEGDNPCVVLVDENGLDRTGPFMDLTSGMVRDRLVARVGV
jgi:hypothetical protein